MASHTGGIVQSAHGSSAATAPALHKLFTRISEASPLSQHALSVLQLTGQEETRFEDLLSVIQQDPALAARIMRCINSAYYGLRHTVTDLRSAIGLLGFRELRNIAMTVFIGRLFQCPGDYGDYTRENLWHHLVGVATTSRLVSLVCSRGAPDESFMAGLLHDIGIILIDLNLRPHFCRVLHGLKEDTPTVEVEKNILTFDHTEIGEFVAQRWNFPESVTASIRYHHCPQDYNGPEQDVVNVVSVANYLCSRYGCTSVGVHNVAPPADEVFASLQLDGTNLRIIWEELDATLEKASVIAGI